MSDKLSGYTEITSSPAAGSADTAAHTYTYNQDINDANVTLTAKATLTAMNLPIEFTTAPFGVNHLLDLAAAPATLDFGYIALGSKSVAKAITVRGNPSKLTQNIAWNAPSAFTVTADTGWDSKAGGTLLVTFHPSAAQAYSETLTISSGAYSQTVQLSGTGINPAPVGGGTFVPASLTYMPGVTYNDDGSVTITVNTASSFNGMVGNAVVPSSGYSVQVTGGKTVITIDAETAKGLHGQRLTARFSSGTASFMLNLPSGAVVDVDEWSAQGTLLKKGYIYSDPTGARNDRVRSVKKGESFAVTGWDDKWATVEYGDGQVDYIQLSLLKIEFSEPLRLVTVQDEARLYTRRSESKKYRKYIYPKAGARFKATGIYAGYYVVPVYEKDYYMPVRFAEQP